MKKFLFSTFGTMPKILCLVKQEVLTVFGLVSWCDCWSTLHDFLLKAIHRYFKINVQFKLLVLKSVCLFQLFLLNWTLDLSNLLGDGLVLMESAMEHVTFPDPQFLFSCFKKIMIFGVLPIWGQKIRHFSNFSISDIFSRHYYNL